MNRLLLTLGCVILTASQSATAATFHCKFDFNPAGAAPGAQSVSPTDAFDKERGYGFDFNTTAEAGATGVTSARPFYFSVAVPEGNYAVTVIFGDAKVATTNTLKAEARRLLIESVVTKPGEFATRKVVVNVRTPAISDGSHVKLKQREKDNEMINWDEKLTLEFNGSRPGVASMEVSAVDVPTVFLVGDSTVCDQPNEPWNSWGQMLPRFFGPGVAIANHAQSGESIKSSLGAKRFDKVFATMKAGDWVLVQFGHNDMKDKATNALATYKANLKQIVARTRERGGTLVLVTSMERKAGVEKDTLAGYPQSIRDVAKEDGVALIDLQVMSRAFYRALGPDLDKAFQDGTHHNNYGSYELAKCIAEGIRQNKLPLARHLAEDFTGFDPAKPDPLATFGIPESPTRSDKKPDGN